MCACWGRLLSDGMRARLLIHACETTVTPAHDEPLEEQAARAQTNSGYARNGTLFPQVYRAAAPPVASKKIAFHVFFFSNCHRTYRCRCSVVELHFDMRNQLSNISMIFQDTRLCSWVWSLIRMRYGSWTLRCQLFPFAEPVKNSNELTLSRA